MAKKIKVYNFACFSLKISLMLYQSQMRFSLIMKLARKQGINIHATLQRIRKTGILIQSEV